MSTLGTTFVFGPPEDPDPLLRPQLRKRRDRLELSDELHDWFRARGYVVEKSAIGSGTFGTVFAGTRPDLGRKVAIKILHEATGAGNVLNLLEREAKLIEAVDHRGVVRVYDLGMYSVPEEFGYFIVMERVTRPLSLTEFVFHPRHQKTTKQILRLLASVALAVHAVHEANELESGRPIVHGDLKPSNILVGRQGGRNQIKIVDFGLAREVNLSKGRSFIGGTPAYMAPQQAMHGEQPDTRDDIFALGAIGYELLKRSSVRSIPAGSDWVSLIANERALSLDWKGVPSDIATVLRKALAHRREDRYQTAREFAEELLRPGRARVPLACKGPRWIGLRVWRATLRHPGRLAVVAGAAVAAAITWSGADMMLDRQQANQRAIHELLQTLAATRAFSDQGPHSVLDAIGSRLDDLTWSDPQEQARSLELLRHSYWAAGDHEHALSSCTRAYELYKKHLGVLNTTTVNGAVTAAESAYHVGRCDRVAEVHREVFSQNVNRLGLSHAAIRSLTRIHGVADSYAGRHEQAIAELIGVVELEAQKGGPISPTIDQQSIRSLEYLAEALMDAIREMGPDSVFAKQFLASRIDSSATPTHSSHAPSAQSEIEECRTLLTDRYQSVASACNDSLGMRQSVGLCALILADQALAHGVALLGLYDSGAWVMEWLDLRGRARLMLAQTLSDGQEGAPALCSRLRANALVDFEAAVAQRRQAIGDRHVETLRSRRGAAAARFALGEQQAAIAEMRTVVRDAEALGRRGNDFYLAQHRLELVRMLLSYTPVGERPAETVEEAKRLADLAYREIVDRCGLASPIASAARAYLGSAAR